MEYNYNNVFAKIIKNELPAKKIYEDEYILCFEDAYKSAEIHWLFIPKGHYVCFDDFIAKAAKDEVSHFFQTIQKVAQEHGLSPKGYKLVTNNGKGAGQSVFHFHVHLLSGPGLRHL